MEDSVVDPHEKMRARDVEKVATGKQAPRPPHDPASISQSPPPSDDTLIKVVELKTAPNDVRFPCTNQTRHCYARYIEYHKCARAKGGNTPECEKFASYYRSLCPEEWILRWNEQVELGIFPGPL
ncbi:cytochrome c oxidase subunit 6b-3-like [Telopea speciosissima]|uniref:cytochrome c oxidase subunit 6b-3-like n=1 Tax=Telopea speciosissima TaxID=54955 RepID=UPI001CC53322|nr:cytochrome c oxidase subunit 6b-3-like [Telopea speciosissima]